MMISSNVPMSFSLHLTLEMLLFWTVALHLPVFKEIQQEADNSLLQDSIFDEFGDLHQ